MPTGAIAAPLSDRWVPFDHLQYEIRTQRVHTEGESGDKASDNCQLTQATKTTGTQTTVTLRPGWDAGVHAHLV